MPWYYGRITFQLSPRGFRPHILQHRAHTIRKHVYRKPWFGFPCLVARFYLFGFYAIKIYSLAKVAYAELRRLKRKVTPSCFRSYTCHVCHRWICRVAKKCILIIWVKNELDNLCQDSLNPVSKIVFFFFFLVLITVIYRLQAQRYNISLSLNNRSLDHDPVHSRMGLQYHNSFYRPCVRIPPMRHFKKLKFCITLFHWFMV